MARIETNSSTWRAVREWADLELAETRKQLEASHPVEYTEKLRGRILQLKGLLALPDKVNKDD